MHEQYRECEPRQDDAGADGRAQPRRERTAARAQVADEQRHHQPAEQVRNDEQQFVQFDGRVV